ncbi:MAG: DUF5794 domain-containing protein, partial [Halapricum sp.]
RFAAIVILAVAAKTASARIGDLLPRPAVIVGLGLLASVQPESATLAFSTDLGLVARGVAAALVGVAFAVSVALAGPSLRRVVDLDRFRFGSAVALGMLPLSIFGLIPENAPLALAVLGLTILLAFDPDRAGEGDEPADRIPQTSPAATDGGSGVESTAAEAESDGITGDPGLNDSGDSERYQAPWL